MDRICKEKYHANNALFKEVKSGKCDRYFFSPYNINTFSSRQVVRINKSSIDFFYTVRTPQDYHAEQFTLV